MYKMLIIIISIFFFFPIASFAHEEEEDGHHESLDVVLQEIQDVSCDQLSDDEFERIGDAVMEEMHPGDAHVQMDNMMGGEGSDSLRQMHIQMGKNYLGCESTMPMMGMMKPMMWGNREAFGFNQGGDTNMMGYGGGTMMSGGGVYSTLGIVVWILVVVLLVVMIRYFWNRGGDKK